MAADSHWHDLLLGEPVVAGVETIDVGYVQLRLIARTLPGRQFEVGREIRLRAATALRSAGDHLALHRRPGPVMTGPVDPTEVNPTVVNAGASRVQRRLIPRSRPDTDPKHSALVGYMSVPVNPRFPIRRSTLLMVVLFLGFGTLCYLYPPAGNSAGRSTGTGAIVSGPNGDVFVPRRRSPPPQPPPPRCPRPPHTTTAPRPPVTTTTTTRATNPTTTSRPDHHHDPGLGLGCPHHDRPHHHDHIARGRRHHDQLHPLTGARRSTVGGSPRVGVSRRPAEPRPGRRRRSARPARRRNGTGTGPGPGPPRPP